MGTIFVVSQEFFRSLSACSWCGRLHIGAECPKNRDDAAARIRYMIDLITGQPRKIADSYRADLAKEINYWRATRDWGPDVYRKMLDDPLMRPHLSEAAKAPAALYGMIEMIGHNGGPQLDDDELSEQQKDLALSPALLKFVDDEANKYGKNNHGMISDLVAAGQKALESCVRSFDRRRGKYEHYAKSAVRNAMLKKLREHGIIFGKRIKHDKPAKRHRSSTGGYIDKSYITVPTKQRESRLISDELDEEAMERALDRDERIALRHIFKHGNSPRSIRLLAGKLSKRPTERRARDIIQRVKIKYDQALISKNVRSK